MRRLRPAVIGTAALAGALVVVGLWLAIAGLPERTPTQRTMLQLSQAAFALAALAAIIEMAWERRAWRQRSFRLLGAIAGVLLAIALIGVTGGLVFGWAWAANGFAQGLGWAGIALLFGWLVVDSTRRDRRLRRRYIIEGEDAQGDG